MKPCAPVPGDQADLGTGSWSRPGAAKHDGLRRLIVPVEQLYGGDRGRADDDRGHSSHHYSPAQMVHLAARTVSPGRWRRRIRRCRGRLDRVGTVEHLGVLGLHERQQGSGERELAQLLQALVALGQVLLDGVLLSRLERVEHIAAEIKAHLTGHEFTPRSCRARRSARSA